MALKVSDKINVIKNLVNIADKILIGGGMAYTFIKAQGKEIGLSLLEEDKIDFAKDLLENNGDQIVLPVDCKIAKEFSNDAKSLKYLSMKSLQIKKQWILDLKQ